MRKDQNLSKAEIEGLAQAISGAITGEESAPQEVRSYDFAHPDRLSRRNLRALEMIFSGLAVPWARTLSSALKAEVEVEAKTVEQSSLRAYAESAPGARAICPLSAGPGSPAAAFVDLPQSFALSTVDRLTGGAGEARDEDRPLTQIERNIVRRLVDRLIPDLEEAWRPVALFSFAVSGFSASAEEMAPDMDQLAIVAEFAWTFGGNSHAVHVLVPLMSLNAFLEDLDPRAWLKSEGAAVNTDRASLTELLEPVGLDFSVRLGRGRLRVEDVLNLEIGDVVKLDTRIDDTLVVEVGGQVMFQARPGLVGSRLSVQIAGRSEPESKDGEAGAGRMAG